MPIPLELNTAEFAEHMDTIRVLYLADDDFKSLCDDYSTVKSSIEKFKYSAHEKKREMEYKHLSEELEKEILKYIKNKK